MRPWPCCSAARTCSSPLTARTSDKRRARGAAHTAAPQPRRGRQDHVRGGGPVAVAARVSAGIHGGMLMRLMRRRSLGTRMRPAPMTAPIAWASGSGSAANTRSSERIRRARMVSIALGAQLVGIVGVEDHAGAHPVRRVDLQFDPAHGDVVVPVGLAEVLVLEPARYAFDLEATLGDVRGGHVVEGGDGDELHGRTLSGMRPSV